MTRQQLTPYQSQYYAWLLTRRAACDTVESLASTLVDSQVNLNPIKLKRRYLFVKTHFLVASSSLTKLASARPSKRVSMRASVKQSTCCRYATIGNSLSISKPYGRQHANHPHRSQS